MTNGDNVQLLNASIAARDWLRADLPKAIEVLCGRLESDAEAVGALRRIGRTAAGHADALRASVKDRQGNLRRMKPRPDSLPCWFPPPAA